MSRDVKVEWAGRHVFHEVAEALGVDTEDIMAVHERKADNTDRIELRATAVVMYTPDQGEIWLAIVKRDESGIVRVLHKREEPGLKAEIFNELKRQVALDVVDRLREESDDD